MNKRSSVAAFGISALALSAVAAVGIGPAQAGDDHSGHGHSHDNRTVSLKANLTELNDSGASGKAHVLMRGEEILKVTVRAKGLSPDAPHAQHIHYGEQARNECPTLAMDDTNDDGRLNTVEGVPAYGPVVVSLTTEGDTSPDSVLAVTRYPVSEDGRLDYRRNNIPFTDVAGTGYQGGGTAEEIAEAVANGEGVVVIHGIDYDGNGEYSLSEEGFSELDPSLPAEATDPAVCGVLR